MKGRNLQQAVGTPFDAPWLVALRVLWVALAILVLAIFFASVPAMLRNRQVICTGPTCLPGELGPADARALAALGLPLGFLAWSETIWALVILVTLLVIATVIFGSQPNNRMAVLTSFWLVAFFPTFFDGLMQGFVRAEPGWYWPVTFVEALGIWLSLLCLFLFPIGRFVTALSRLILLAVTVYALSLLLFTSWLAVMDGATLMDRLLRYTFWGLMVAGLAAQTYRYRHSYNVVERQQSKWILFGMALFVLEDIGFNLLPLFFPSFLEPGLVRLLYEYIGTTFTQSLLLVFVLFLAIAIFRYRLWDIDLVIRRALIYGPLTALLVLFYFGIVVVLEGMFRVIVGHQSDVAIIISTLAVAALFATLRARVQRGIDRRFFRRKYDASQVLAAFGARMRDEVDLSQLTDELLAVVEETLVPAHISIWLKTKQDSEKEE